MVKILPGDTLIITNDSSKLFCGSDRQRTPNTENSKKYTIICAVAVQLPSCVQLCNSMDRNFPGLPVPYHLLEFVQVHVHCVGDAIHWILWCPLLFLPSIFPSIRDFTNELSVCIRWPEYWSFSFNISPSSECSGLISLEVDFKSKGLSGVSSSTSFWSHQ